MKSLKVAVIVAVLLTRLLRESSGLLSQVIDCSMRDEMDVAIVQINQLMIVYEETVAMPCPKPAISSYTEDAMFRILQHLEPFRMMFSKIRRMQTDEVVSTLDWIIHGVANSGKLQQEVQELLEIGKADSKVQQLAAEVLESFPFASVDILKFLLEVCSIKSTNCGSTNFTTTFTDKAQRFQQELSKFHNLFMQIHQASRTCETFKVTLQHGKVKQLHLLTEPTRNFYQALRYCALRNATLISFESETEEATLIAHMTTTSTSNSTFFLGASSSDDEFFWLTTGKRVNHTAASNQHECLALQPHSATGKFAFTVIDCSQRQGFICQKLIHS